MSSSWAKPGLEVVKVNYGWTTRYGETRTIAKVHKNGNFLLDGDSQQFRPQSNGRATATGNAGRYSSVGLLLLTDEVRAEIIRAAALEEAQKTVRAEIRRLEAIRSDDAYLAEAERIAASKPEPSP